MSRESGSLQSRKTKRLENQTWAKMSNANSRQHFISSGFCVRVGTLPPTYLGPLTLKQVRCLDVEWTKRKVRYNLLLYDLEEMVVN